MQMRVWVSDVLGPPRLQRSGPDTEQDPVPQKRGLSEHPSDQPEPSVRRIAHDSPHGPERGGPLPVIMLPLKVTGRLLIGHTRSISDPAAPVLIRECDVLEPGTPAVDLRCAGCVPKTQIGRLGDDTLALIEHRFGCLRLAELTELAEKAGVL